MNYSTHIPEFQLALRSAIAAALALWVAQLLELQHPLYAMIATVLVTDLSALETRKLGMSRLVGTLLGAALGAAISMVMQSTPWVIGLSILLAMLLSQLLKLHYAARLTGYVCAIVILDHGNEPWAYAFYRTLETLLGIALAVLVSMVPKLIRMDQADLQDS